MGLESPGASVKAEPNGQQLKTSRDFSIVTELPGDRITREAMRMLQTRYRLASNCCAGKDVLELACGPCLGETAILGCCAMCWSEQEISCRWFAWTHKAYRFARSHLM